MEDMLYIFNFFIILSLLIIFIGIFGVVFNFKNFIIFLLSIELSLLGINLFLIFSSIIIDDFLGLIFSLIVLTVAAAEAAIGLSLLILFFKIRGNIFIFNKYFLRN